jgi:hypothetical protein
MMIGAPQPAMSPIRAAGWPPISTVVPVPIRGTGAWSIGTIAGGVIVIWIMSFVLIRKSPTAASFRWAS